MQSLDRRISTLILIVFCMQAIFADAVLALHPMSHSIITQSEAPMLEKREGSFQQEQLDTQQYIADHQHGPRHDLHSVNLDTDENCEDNCHCACTHFAMLTPSFIYPLLFMRSMSEKTMVQLTNNFLSNLYRPPIV